VFDYRSNGGVNFAQAIVYGADHGAVYKGKNKKSKIKNKKETSETPINKAF
jgi:hypothetical protein